ncbi:3,4-dihydroxy-2-butanone-4-phosphate synthase [Alginatibacterium sediminis]|uniref:3,4-dihydroxy-2-butanone 4-phosphate synthase n=1 Tax=Alginatibacterium sediminis TaxID=2164068 RepID=A0A420ED20_9ALTE|nr:bifunctional 3,4-dihydroxy-2-butanone-4-phosphate synthase/GTP cyclohydrolase II [Alginatibacterium sediminis]RKF18570.1 3,4-dihydroxy-2-butanone-4-phosphate synthase [Alginatibacterium sediminis]
MALSSIEEIIADIRDSKMVVLMDDEDRENEGDLIVAADAITPEIINFMATHGRGLICLPMTKSRCQQLKLPLMVDENSSGYYTAFTVSIEAAEGVTTGISAADRAATVLAAVQTDAKPSDLAMPGHIFPLMAKEGGVLSRAGHTEASTDLARLAGFEPAAVIVEILNEDGSMARRDDLEIFCEKHQLKMGTIADLIEYRNLNETTIERLDECTLPTAYGEFKLVSYKDTIDQRVHFALLAGNVDSNAETTVRVHLHNSFNDLFASDRVSKMSWPLDQALAKLSQDKGVLVLLNADVSAQDLIEQVRNFAQLDKGEAPIQKTNDNASRNVGVGSQILSDLGVRKMRLLSSPKHYHALSGFGLEVVDYIENN